MQAANRGLTSSFDEHGSGALTLNRAGPAGEDGSSWASLDVQVFARLRVRATCRPKPPLEVALVVLGLVSPSPLSAPAP